MTVVVSIKSLSSFPSSSYNDIPVASCGVTDDTENAVDQSKRASSSLKRKAADVDVESQDIDQPEIVWPVSPRRDVSLDIGRPLHASSSGKRTAAPVQDEDAGQPDGNSTVA